MAKHALLSASGSSRWLECTPSARFELQFPKSTSDYAEEGTAAHELCELTARYWLGDITEKAYENKLANLQKGKYYNEEMRECANDYGRYISETVKAAREKCPDAIAELEVNDLDFSDWAPEGFGTGDCVIVADDTLEIIDFKYGKGVLVEAKGNTQMRLYALGAIKLYGELYNIKRVKMSIIQPRITRGSNSDEISVDELMEWAENYVKPRAALAFAGNGEFRPGEKTCRFCRAKQQCKARAEQNLALFDNAPEIITAEDAGQILARAADIKAWLSDLENLVMTKLFAGGKVTGWKIVEGKSSRKYVDEDKVAEAMIKAGFPEADLYTRSVLGITAMEKMFGKKEINKVLKGLIYKPEGKPTLAREDDKRPAYSPKDLVLRAFDDASND